jgi:hypothetical protein
VILEHLVTHVQNRLKDIQARHNFNPDAGHNQVRALPELARAYGQFEELLSLIDELHLHIPVPYDPVGLQPSEHQALRADRQVHVYFIQKDGTNFWKIGSSTNPNQRVNSIQTGNEGPISVRHIIENGGEELETLLQRRLQPWKTRDRNDTEKGEWFELDPVYVSSIIPSLRAGMTEFPLPTIQPHGSQKA